jgi:outer membrane murein-binding lipoprotein Lpp
MRSRIAYLTAVLPILAIAGGCGKSKADSASNIDLQAAEIAALKSDLSKLRQDLADLRITIDEGSKTAAAPKFVPAIAKVKLYKGIQSNLEDAGAVLCARLGIPKQDIEKVHPNFNQRRSLEEYHLKELQKMVDTLARTAVLNPAE